MDKQYFSILQWIVERGVVNEKGEPFDFTDRPFLLDILTDWTPQIVVTACAQVGKSVTFSIKCLFATKHLRFNTIYTMPTDGDAKEFVASKFNKIIQANKDEFAGMETDSVERKELNDRFIYFKGTIGKSAAVSTTADVLVHDELSRSDQNTIATYKSRTKASQYKGRWLFSNPGSERDELDLVWHKSDKKEWCITCPHCKSEHYLSFPESVDMVKKCYICKACKEPISDSVRRRGRWIAQEPGGTVSGYHISHLMCPWIKAEEVIEDSYGDPAYFNNFVLGLPYSPGDLSVTKTTILDIWTPKDLSTGEVYIGIDVGNIKHYIIRSKKGIIKIGTFSAWTELDDILRVWKPKAGVIDAMPDNVAAKHYVETYNFMLMSFFQENNNNPQTIVWWGDHDRKGIVYSHRDRILDQHLTNMIEAKWLIGVPADKNFRDYIKHYETLRRAKVTNNKGIERYVWESTTGTDHYCFDGDTPIETSTGIKIIKDISPGEYVLTRNGYKKVLHSGITQKTSVVEATFSNGSSLICTDDHPFYVEGYGMKPLRDLLCSDILVSICRNQLYSTELHSEGIRNLSGDQIESILHPVEQREQKVSVDFTRKYGSTTTVLFGKAIVYIIKIITLSIMKLRTLNVKKKEHTNQITRGTCGKTMNIEENNAKESLRKHHTGLKSLLNGLKQKKGLLISRRTRNTCEHTSSSSVSSVRQMLFQRREMVANSVAKNAQVDLTHVNGERNTQTIRLDTIKQINGERDVYNLFVEEDHEYYANGILVSNCFADLYSYLAMLGEGAGVFYSEDALEEKPSVLGADNVYDVTNMFKDNNYGNY